MEPKSVNPISKKDFWVDSLINKKINNLNRHFTKDISVADKIMRRCSTSLVI